MSLWKKAVGGLATAALLTTIVAPAAFASKSPSTTGADQSDYINCTVAAVASGNPATGDTCSQAAGGTVKLNGEVPAAGFPLGGLRVDVSGGATIVAIPAGLTPAWQSLSSTAVFVPAGSAANWVAAANQITVLMPATAGSVVATVTIYDATGVPSAGGTLTITVTAGAAVNVDPTKSLIVVTSGACPAPGGGLITDPPTITNASASPAGLNRGCVWALLVDGNGQKVNTLPSSGDKVVFSIAPFGTLGATAAQSVSSTTYYNDVKVGSTTYGGWAIGLNSTGVAGATSISVSTTYRGVAVALTPKAFTWTGDLSKVDVSQRAFSVAAGATKRALRYVPVDATGAKIRTGVAGGALDAGVTVTAAVTGSVFTAGTPLGYDPTVSYSTNGDNGAVYINCIGTGTGTLKVTVTINAIAKTSDAITIRCGAGDPDKMTLKANTTAIPAGGSTIFVATLVDSNGYPAVDGTQVNAIASAGSVLGDGTTAASPGLSATLNGIAEFTYFANFTLGPVTIAAVDGTSGISASLNLTIGEPSPLFITTTNKLNLPTASPTTYNTATEVARFGQYVTWRGFAGTALANETIGVEVAAKNADGTWSAFTRLTSRKADANGVVLFYWRESSAKWLSVRFVGPAGNTGNAVQARWR